jgi:formate/nitrite transporter FocA (FNT family)
MALAARQITGKIFTIFLPIMVFVAIEVVCAFSVSRQKVHLEGSECAPDF